MTERKCINLLKRDWEQIASNSSLIDEAKQWYPKEHDYSRNLANKYNLSLQQITGMYAAFSPLKSVAENKRILIDFLKGKQQGHTAKQINKAKLILQTSNIDKIDVILRGMKTTAFHRHIFNPLDKDRVCVDRHVIKYFNFGENVCITPKRYTTYSNAIKVWSEKINMYPSELQALVWLYAKKKYGINI